MSTVKKGDKFDPGALDRKIIIRTYATTEDSEGLGYEIKGDTVDVTVSASIMEADPNKETEVNNATKYKEVLKCVIRYRGYLKNTKATLIYEGVEYDITQVRELPNSGRRAWMVIKAVSYE